MTVVFNHMQDWIYASKDLNLLSKLLLERMISLSKDGEQQVFINRDEFSKKLGVDPSSITRAFKQLVAFKLIEEVKNTNPFNRIKNFKITAKALSDRELHNAIIDNGIKQSSSIAKDNHRASHNATLEPCIMQFSSLDRKVGRKVGEKESVTPSVSHTFDEVFVLFKTNAKELSSDYPRIQEMDLNLIAKKYFNFREEQKWKGVKNLNLNINSWLLSEIEHDKKQPTNSKGKPDFFNNLNKIFEMKSPETLAEPQEKIIDVEASIVD